AIDRSVPGQRRSSEWPSEHPTSASPQTIGAGPTARSERPRLRKTLGSPRCRWPCSDCSAIVGRVLWNPAAETLPRERLASLQLERLRQALRRQIEDVPLTRERLHAVGVHAAEDVATLDDVRRLPFTFKTDLREHYPFGLFAVPRDQVV